MNDKAQSPTALALVQKRMQPMQKVLPPDTSLRQRFQQAALGLARSRDLVNCTPESVYSAIYSAARLNLIPDPVLHLAAIVPFKNHRTGRSEATLIVEYRGLISLAKAAVPELTLATGTVHVNDDYELVEGSENTLRILKRWWEKGLAEPGPMLFSWASSTSGHGTEFSVVPAADAMELAQRAKGGYKPGRPWHDHFEAMAEKTAIRRLSKRWRMDPTAAAATRFSEAITIDERTEELPAPGPEVIDAEVMDPEPTIPAGKNPIHAPPTGEPAPSPEQATAEPPGGEGEEKPSEPDDPSLDAAARCITAAGEALRRAKLQRSSNNIYKLVRNLAGDASLIVSVKGLSEIGPDFCESLIGRLADTKVEDVHRLVGVTE